jgi:N-acetylglucosaminyldiphosphoundecaprenol N-acetyl-beta-D-mannosaminyltransferase
MEEFDNAVSRARRCVWIVGVPVDQVTLDEAVDLIFELVDDGRRRGITHQVATVNVDFLVNALTDTQQRTILQRTSLSVADGMPIVWGSRILGGSLPERVAGADLVPALAARAAATGSRLALVGAGPGVAEHAAALLREAYPDLDVVGLRGPRFDSVEDVEPEDLRELVELGADVCCVAFGNPKQELFIDRFRDELGIPVMIGVGGSLDFLVGEKRRAPSWMQRSGLEWAHRAASEPRRLVLRYARDGWRFVPALLSQTWRGRPSIAPFRLTARVTGEIVVDLSGVDRVDNQIASDLASIIRSGLRSSMAIRVVGIDTPAAGEVLGFDALLRNLSSDATEPAP